MKKLAETNAVGIQFCGMYVALEYRYVGIKLPYVPPYIELHVCIFLCTPALCSQFRAVFVHASEVCCVTKAVHKLLHQLKGI